MRASKDTLQGWLINRIAAACRTQILCCSNSIAAAYHTRTLRNLYTLPRLGDPLCATVQ